MTAAAVLLLALSSTQPSPCIAPASAAALDHAIIVVKDLDAAAAAFARDGFRIKPGRLHENGLLNKHIKFRNRTSIELMTVARPPGDSMARGYAQMLAEGEGGVYLAMKAENTGALKRAATQAGLVVRERAYDPWTFVSFPAGSPGEAVFFSIGDVVVNDPPELLRHQPDVSGLVEVWIEAGTPFGRLLSELGARDCGTAERDGIRGQRWGLRNGAVVIVPPPRTGRSRVLGAVLGGAAALSEARPHRRFWIRRIE